MHPDELDIVDPLERRLLAEQFPRWADLPIQPVQPMGTDSGEMATIHRIAALSRFAIDMATS
jgi:hypothetical protein